jgi:iron complex outermembrane receptor protein
VSNVTHTRITSFVGPNENLLKDSYSVPRTFWLGVRYTPKL